MVAIRSLMKPSGDATPLDSATFSTYTFHWPRVGAFTTIPWQPRLAWLPWDGQLVASRSASGRHGSASGRSGHNEGQGSAHDSRAPSRRQGYRSGDAKRGRSGAASPQAGRRVGSCLAIRCGGPDQAQPDQGFAEWFETIPCGAVFTCRQEVRCRLSCTPARPPLAAPGPTSASIS